MTDLVIGPREILAILLAIAIILDVAAWRTFEPGATEPS